MQMLKDEPRRRGDTFTMMLDRVISAAADELEAKDHEIDRIRTIANERTCQKIKLCSHIARLEIAVEEARRLSETFGEELTDEQRDLVEALRGLDDVKDAPQERFPARRMSMEH